MARSLTVSLSKTYYLTSSSSPTRCSSRLLTLRAQSNIPNRNNPSESDDSSSSSSTDPLLRKLEDAIHGIIVRRAAPDWLPFLPGSSYWVPPPRSASGSLGIAHLVEKLANPLSDEESLSTSTVRGWPSSDYFVEGAPPQPVEVVEDRSYSLENRHLGLSKHSCLDVTCCFQSPCAVGVLIWMLFDI
ncbi:REPETITIVE MATRIX PROTEIN 2 putative ISOFORM 1-RELATED [Salix viminalis]|uniref:REPETITIVE MATRIX PROTEIN 2 putative ISOFORM 1-RELATED n=1 Tax=Salix viminalis TaxID=40686 RepID=A0A9Q0Z3J2_SALVM|nr:REPETITIVE MATRIX PROTEIN 2 putative ISOFORM 1-RELATED [Salix viminalis]